MSHVNKIDYHAFRVIKRMMNTTFDINVDGRALTSLQRFCQHCGVSEVTAWRWRRNGWLKTVNICGRQYVTDKALAEFMRRVEAGEFAREHKTPKRR